jgi:hypothetical protein
MRRILHRALVVALAIAIGASGATLGLAAHAAPVQVQALQQSQPHAHHGAAADHAAHAATASATDEPGAPTAPHDAFTTCCSLCTLASPLQPVAGDAVSFTVTAVSFASRPSFATGRVVLVEPGIPKRSA